jgi:branched-chain amino acid transport system ATP-binding protein
MLEVQALDSGYGRAQALWGVSLSVEDGEIVTIVGPNGAGKSTLVNVLAGILPTWRGSLRLAGEEYGGMAPHEVCKRGVALVPEGRRIFPKMTVRENLLMGSYSSQARPHADQTWERVLGIFPFLRQRSRQLAGSLSGGEAQMLAIGRALMARPRLLLLDEPSLGLAPVVVEGIYEVLREINSDGVSIMLVEQNVVEALELASRGYVLEEGRIVQEGPADRLLADERLQRAYFGV